MLKFSSSGVSLAKFALSLTVVAALAACGGSDAPAVVKVAAVDTTAAVTAASVSALVTTTPTVATFDTGFSGVDGTLAAAPVTLAGPTTVAFTSTSATPTFAITNDGLTATGVTTFGSCIFTVDANSPFPVGHPLAPNSVVKVNPCNLKASTSGASANGVLVKRDVVLVLGTASSKPVLLDVAVNTNGTVLIGSTSLGTVTLTTTTGGGS